MIVDESPLISICIPSYNRPVELLRLLRTIDATQASQIEIVICEDDSPKRREVRANAESFIQNTSYFVRYIENEQNYGYDRNLRELIQQARGDYIVFMGDDDEFLPGGLDKLLNFLQKYQALGLGYVMKTHILVHPNQDLQLFKYFPQDMFFPADAETYMTLFRRSVFISGFTVRRAFVMPYLTDQFDGTLLFQLYLLAEVTLHHPSAYFAEPIVRQYKEAKTPFFGSSASEQALYDPGTISIRNSLNFMQGFFKITQFMDAKYHLHSTEILRTEFSKYAYPVLSVQRNKGSRQFLRYAYRLAKEIKIHHTVYFYIYLFGLLVCGESLCDAMIVRIKNFLGRTPRL